MGGFGMAGMNPMMGMPVMPASFAAMAQMAEAAAVAANAAAAAAAMDAAAAAHASAVQNSGGSSTEESPQKEALWSMAETTPPQTAALMPPTGTMPGTDASKGSQMHGTGKCRPCAWFWKPQGCQSALECGYCHACPEGELKSRKKVKVAAMRMGALAPAKPGVPPGGARTLKLTSLL